MRANNAAGSSNYVTANAKTDEADPYCGCSGLGNQLFLQDDEYNTTVLSWNAENQRWTSGRWTFFCDGSRWRLNDNTLSETEIATATNSCGTTLGQYTTFSDENPIFISKQML
jgi:hypothetical protein